MKCKNCGGKMIGDGYSEPIRCENIDIDNCCECDADPIYCEDGDGLVIDEKFDGVIVENEKYQQFYYPCLSGLYKIEFLGIYK